MKPLLKSMREANRYVLGKIDSTVDFKTFEKDCFLVLHEWIGKFDIGQYDIQLLKDRFADGYFVIVTNSRGVDKVRAALELWATSESISPSYSVSTIMTSGTLKKVKAHIESTK